MQNSNNKLYRIGTGSNGPRLTLRIETLEPCCIFFKRWKIHTDYLNNERAFALIVNVELELRNRGYVKENETSKQAEESIDLLKRTEKIYIKRGLI